MLRNHRGKVQQGRRVSAHLGLWKREVGQMGGIGQLVLGLGENSDGVCGIRDSVRFGAVCSMMKCVRVWSVI